MFNQDDLRKVETGTVVGGLAAAGLFALAVALLAWLLKTRGGRALLLVLGGTLALGIGGAYLWHEMQPGQKLCANEVSRKFFNLVAANGRAHPNDLRYSMGIEFVGDPQPHVQHVRYLWKHDQAVIRTEMYECRVEFLKPVDLHPMPKTPAAPFVPPPIPPMNPVPIR